MDTGAGRPAPVDVVVVSWNTRHLLARCLESLDGAAAHVWVVDNASTDGSAELVRADHPAVTLVEAPTNIGFGPAANLAAAAGRSDWLVVANADVAPEPDALQALLASGTADDRVGVVAPRLIAPDGSTQHSVHAFPRFGTSVLFNSGAHRLLRGRAAQRALPGHWNPELAREIDWAYGALLLIRRSAWDELGGFDPAQWLYAEDLDLCWRARQSGWIVRYAPGARVRHEIAAASRRADWQETAQTRAQRSAYAWMLRHWGPVTMRACASVNLTGAVVRWLGAAATASLPGRAATADRVAHSREYVRMHATGFARRAELDRHR